MPHEWILQVLSDLQDYALANGLDAIAQMAGEGLLIARAELSTLEPPTRPPDEGLH